MTTGDRVKLATRRLSLPALPGDWRPVRRAGGPASGARRQSFKAWRRSRPFVGGLLLLLGGLELLGIPLSGILSRGAIKLVIYIGIGGVFGVLIGVLLITAGIAMWANPEHRAFYGVAGVLLGIISIPASNLGGFFVCTLLAIMGGSIAFAWTPDGSVASPSPAVPHASAVPDGRLGSEPPTLPDSLALADSPTLPESGESAESPAVAGERASGAAPAGGSAESDS